MTKITQLGDAALPLDPTDLVEVVQQVSTTPVNKKVPVSRIGGGGNLPDAGSPALADEFDDATIHADWVRSDSVGEDAHGVWIESSGMLAFRHTGAADTTGEFHGLVRPLGALTFPLTVDAAVRMQARNVQDPMCSVVLSDQSARSGTQIQAVAWFNNTARMNRSLRRGSNWSTDSATGATTTYEGAYGWAHIRLVWESATVFRYYASVDGVAWVLIDSQTFTFTPTFVGVAVSSWRTETPVTAAFEYLRVYSSNLGNLPAGAYDTL